MWAVTGTDLNAATALLHRWWDVLEAPAGTSLKPRFRNLLHPDVVVEWNGRTHRGSAEVIAAVEGLPRTSVVTHHPVSLEMHETGAGCFTVQAELIHQIQNPAGGVRSRHTRHRHTLRKTDSGLPVFEHISMPAGTKSGAGGFSPHPTINRAKATVVEFQTHVDRLDGTAHGLEQLITKDAAFYGLMAADAPIRGIEGLAAWLAAGPSAFRWVRHNRLLSFQLTPLDAGRCEATATFEWLAETHAGERIERRTPVRWTLTETGATFMKIEKINQEI